MLHLIKSNRMEHLVTALCRVISQVPGDPMTPEMIGIQSRGMKQWLTTAVAEAFGICANVEFLFPRQIIERLTRTENNGGQELPRLNRDMMTWAVMDMLGGDALGTGPGAHLSAYVGSDKNGRKTLQLSRKIAACFDDYQVYRPDMLAAWSNNNDTHGGLPSGPADIHGNWQAELWRKLIRLGTPLPQRPEPISNLISDPLAVAGTGNIPERISLFGVSAMPPGFLDAFDILGRIVDVYLFLLTPSNQFFFDLRSKRQVDRMALEADSGAGAHPDMTPGLFDDLFSGQGGNPLLAALGRTGREFHGILENFDYHEPFGELFEDPAPQLNSLTGTGTEGHDTLPMLTVIQSDILNLVHRGNDRDEPAFPVVEGDRSVAVHVCHSPMREAQVLKDLLLDAFRQDPDLSPHDMIVMMPDIEAYAPYLEAVFSQTPRIPYTVSDRRKRSESRTLDAFLKILALTDTRLEAAPVMAVLLAPAVAEKFGLGLADRDRVAEAFTAAGVIWGEDSAHRERLMGKGVEENTWQFGLRRLMAGIAMPDGEDDMVGTVLPGDGFEGLDADILGRAAHFLNTLFSCLNGLSRERFPGEWGDALKYLVRSLLETDHSNEGDIGFLLNAIDQMAAQAAEGGYDKPVGFPVIRDIIEHKLDQNISQGSFLAGSLTFCNLMPMRSIPFKIVCLMGMDEQGFPRTVQAPGFNLIHAAPRPGDKQEREEDCYLFLESLLSARERLIITYTGMSISDNSPIPCAGPVAELLDVMAAGFELPDGQTLETRHPLHPFSPSYFTGAEGDSRLFSYSRAQCRVAETRETLKTNAAPLFFADQISNCNEGNLSWGDVTGPGREFPETLNLEELTAFFRHPVRHYLSKELGIVFPEPGELMADREPFQVAGLEQYHLGALSLSLWDDPGSAAKVRAAGMLPLGTKGETEWERIRGMAAPVHALAESLTPEAIAGHLPAALDLDGIQLTGNIGDVYDSGRIVNGFGAVTPARLLNQWISHLAYCLGAENPGPTVVVGRDPKGKSPAVALEFSPVKDKAADHLLSLVRLYLLGRQQILPFFCAPGFALVETLISRGWKPGDGDIPTDMLDAAIEKSRPHWNGTPFLPGERENRYTALVFGDTDPFKNSESLRLSGIQDTALRVFTPLLENLYELS